MSVVDDDSSGKSKKDASKNTEEDKFLVYIIVWMTKSIKHEIKVGSFGPYTRIKRAMSVTATMPSYLKILKLIKKAGLALSSYHQCEIILKTAIVDADEQNGRDILTLKFDGLGWSVKWHDSQYYNQYRGYKDYISKRNKGMDIREIGPDQISIPF